MLSLKVTAQSPWTQNWPKPKYFGYADIRVSKTGTGVLLDNQTNRILYTENFGKNWIDHPDPTLKGANFMSWPSDSIGFVTVHTNVYKTTNRGMTWTLIPTTAGGTVDFPSNDVGFNYYGVWGGGRFSRTTNGGASWQNRGGVENFNFLCAASANTVFARGINNVLYRSIDGAASWNTYFIPARTDIMWMDFATPNIGIGVGDSGTIARTTNGGTTWQISYLGDSSVPNTVQPVGLHNPKFFDAQNGIIRTTNITLAFITTNAGATWRSIFLPQPMYLTMTSENLLFGVNGSYIGSSTNGGKDWQQLTKGDLNTVTGASFQNANRLWLANGKLIYTDDKGLSFVDKLSNPTIAFRDVKFPTPIIGYALAGNGTDSYIFKTTNGGNTWAQKDLLVQTSNLNVFKSLDRLQFIHPDTGFASGFGGVFKTVDGGNSWQAIYANIIDHNEMANRIRTHFTSANEGVRIDATANFAGSFSTVYKTFDGGATWQIINVNLGFGVMRSPYVEDLHFLDKSNGWFVGRGAVGRTTDGGNTWTVNNSLPNDGYSICFLTPDVGYISGFYLDPYFTTDGGVTWSRTSENRVIVPNYVLLSQRGKLAVMAGMGGGFYIHEGFQRNLIGVVEGSVLKAVTTNCRQQPSRLPLPNRIFTDENDYYTSSDEQGKFQLWLDSGSHQIKQIKLNSVIGRLEDQQCPPNNGGYSVLVRGLQDTIRIEDFVNNVRPCPVLRVSQNQFLLRPCMASRLGIAVRNEGNIASNPTTLHVKFARNLLFVSSSRSWQFDDSDSTYRFELPAIQSLESYFISIKDSVSCNIAAVNGRDLCVTTKVANVPTCLLQSTSNWDGVDLAVSSQCRSGQTRFTIRNNGVSMPSTRMLRLFIDSQFVYESGFQLIANNQMTVSLPATSPAGLARLEVAQSANHPLSTFASAEANCASDVSSNGMFPQPSESPLVDIVCVTVTNSYDPNDKLVWPKGVGTDGNIQPGTELRYVLRFQNTGTDTAFNVVVVDTLSQFLELESLELGLGSHPYRLSVTGKGRPVLNFHFDNILLPDSNRNEPESHGQVSFTIKHKASLPLGTRIENFTDIYFDFNDPIRTNTTLNTLWRPTIVQGVVDTVFEIDQSVVSVIRKVGSVLKLVPNPASGKVEVLTQRPGSIIVFDAQGRIVLTTESKTAQYTLDISVLRPGIYGVQFAGSKPERLVVKP